MAKANQTAKRGRKMGDEGNVAVGAAIGATVGLVISIILVLSLLPTVQDSAAEAKNNPNATAAEKGLVALYPLVFVAIPLIGAAAGGLATSRKA